jgi:hypothetical protein
MGGALPPFGYRQSLESRPAIYSSALTLGAIEQPGWLVVRDCKQPLNSPDPASSRKEPEK